MTVALGICVLAPALWVGGAPPSSLIVASLGVVLVTVIVGLENRRWRWPRGWWLGGVLLAYTLASLLPLPPAVLSVAQPQVEQLLVEIGPSGWRPWSLNPAGTWLEVGELALLCGLFLLGAQFSWQTVAGVVLFTASGVAAVGLVHAAIDAQSIFGLYTPRLRSPNPNSLLTTFVNPNHQASLFLLGAASGFGLGRSLGQRARRSPDASSSRRQSDLARVSLAAASALVVLMFISGSRGALVALAVTSLAVVVHLLSSRDVHGSSPHDKSSARAARATVLVPMALTICVAVWIAWRFSLVGHPYLVDAMSKPQAVLLGLRAWTLSPILGIGRGAFVDALGQSVASPPEPVMVHLESVPATAVVEWGVVGAAAVVMFGLWWARTFRATASPSARIAALGLLGIAIHATLDFSPELLGVAFPMVALAGALAPHPGHRVSRIRAVTTAGGCIALATIAYTMAPFGSYGARIERMSRLESAASVDEPQRQALVRAHPLDAGLRLAIARNAAASGDWAGAEQFARASRRIDPRQVDAWVLESEALARSGHTGEARTLLVEGVTRLRGPPSASFARYVVLRLGAPQDVATALPVGAGAMHLAETLSRTEPEYAQAVAAKLAKDRAMDPTLTRIRARASSRIGDHALALHFSTLAIQLEPDAGESYVIAARALKALGSSSWSERVGLAERALARPKLRDRDWVDELLLELLLERGRPEDLERAQAVASRLLRYHAKAKVLERRQRLAERVSSAKEGHIR